jgi:Zn-dependent peptidase ImmA (M78 family)
MGYRRGFKSEANATAREIRAELGLKDLDRLDPWALAVHLEVPVTPLSDFGSDAPRAVRHFTEVEIDAFSAVTVFQGTRRRIVHNDAHSPGRQASNLTHELSHAVLLHDPTPALDDRGCRLWNQSVEDEAQWLAGAMLLTEDAALYVVRRSISVTAAAQHFGISEQMVIYRLNVTGARTRVARARKFRIVR